MREKSHRVQIWVAVIGLVGVLGTAIFSNWDKIFSQRSEVVVAQPSPSMPASSVREKNGPLFQVVIYYYPSRKEDAFSLKRLLESENYLVNVNSAASDPALTEDYGEVGSYIYFNERDYAGMTAARQIIEKHLGHSVNASKSQEGEEEAPNSIDLVLTNRRGDT